MQEEKAMRLLIAYGTTDGMTAKIADRIASTVRSAGHESFVLPTRKAPRHFDASAFDGILVGASVHAGGFQRSTARFIRRHIATLRERPSGFFAVCMAIASRFPKEREEARRHALRFPVSCGWLTDTVEVFAGALRFSRYGFLRRRVMLSIARKEVGELDPSRDYEYTDWDAVDRFALDFVARTAGDVPVPGHGTA
jgi:menaquinone-dependent protoporphyrinogen oxidase